MITARFPYLNPIRFVKATVPDTFYFADSIPFFETKKEYIKKFNVSDIIRFQFELKASVYDIANSYVELYKINEQNPEFDAELIGEFVPDMAWINGDFVNISCNYSLSDLENGYYFIQVFGKKVIGSLDDVWYSEYFKVLSDTTGTILIKYSNNGHVNGMFFTDHSENPTYFYNRVAGGFKSDGYIPSSTSTVYADQMNRHTLLSGYPFNIKKLIIGDNYGVANYEIDTINRILCCDLVYIDGKKYCKTEGGSFSPSFINKYPFGVWNIELAEADEQEQLHEFDDWNPYIEGDLGIEEIEIQSANFNDGLVSVTIPEMPGILFAVLINGAETLPFPINQLSDTEIEWQVGELEPDTYVVNLVFINP